jgi:TolB-like protein
VLLIALSILILLIATYFFKGGFSRQEDGRLENASENSTRSIAVLPFVNMSADSSQEYFSDGLSEELLNMLAKIPN